MACQGCPLLRVDLPWSCRPDKPAGTGKDDPKAKFISLTWRLESRSTTGQVPFCRETELVWAVGLGHVMAAHAGASSQTSSPSPLSIRPRPDHMHHHDLLGVCRAAHALSNV